MKILFLCIPTKDENFPPLGIAYITSLLNENNHEAIIQEGNNISFKEIINSVEKHKPDIVGIVFGSTVVRFECLKLAEKVKEKYNLPIVIGGPHATLMYKQLLENYNFIDYIVRNEGEYITLELLNCLEQNGNLADVRGISYREKGKLIHNEKAEPIKDLDALPYPDYKFFNLKTYTKQPEHPKELVDYPVGSIISSRGCPYQCTFCSSSNIWGSKIRFRRPETVVDEMEKLYKEYNTKYIVFNDDNFTTDKKRAIEICKLIIKKGLHKKVSWLCRAEVNIIDENLLKWLKKANCHTIEYGIEDTSVEGLKFFKKAHTMEQAYKAFDLTRKYGLETRSYIIIGGDHETKSNIKLKKEALRKLNPTITTSSLLLAFPGTKIFEMGKEKGLWDDTIWLKKCIGNKYHYNIPLYPSEKMSLNELVSASADLDYEWNNSKGNFSFRDNFNIFLMLIKKRDFQKIFFATKSILIINLKSLRKMFFKFISGARNEGFPN